MAVRGIRFFAARKMQGLFLPHDLHCQRIIIMAR